jgi:hypothetical protein
MYLCLGVSILHLYSIFQWDFGTVPTFNYIFINQLSHIVYVWKLLMVVREWLRKWQTSIQNVFIKCIWCKECYVLWFHKTVQFGLRTLWLYYRKARTILTDRLKQCAMYIWHLRPLSVKGYLNRTMGYQN